MVTSHLLPSVQHSIAPSPDLPVCVDFHSFVPFAPQAKSLEAEESERRLFAPPEAMQRWGWGRRCPTGCSAKGMVMAIRRLAQRALVTFPGSLKEGSGGPCVPYGM